MREEVDRDHASDGVLNGLPNAHGLDQSFKRLKIAFLDELDWSLSNHNALNDIFELIPFSSHGLSELKRKRQRFPNFEGGGCRRRALVSRVFQGIPK